jgi:hypothetical protein
MNQWNQLLAILDDVLGFRDKHKSSVRKISQQFDERTNEHVFYLEYRVRRKGEVQSQPRATPNQLQLHRAIQQRAQVIAAANQKNKPSG